VVEVSLVDEAPTRARGGLTVRVGDQFRLDVPVDFDEDALTRVLDVLRRC